MAIYPDVFPEEREGEKAERFVYDQMKTLPTDFDVFYNQEFSGKERGERFDYEIDFIVADLRNDRFNGIACIEVKGGIIKCSSGSIWTQNGLKIKSPTEQALSGLKNFLKIRNPEIEKRIYSGWMVCFPDGGELGNNMLPTMLEEHQLIGRMKLTYLKETLRNFFDSLKERAPDRTGLSKQIYITEFKAPLIRDCGFIPTLSSRIAVDEKAFIKMTARQAEIFRYFTLNPRLIVNGTAGSGKTIIAKEVAQEYYEKGLNVLYMCYNRILANNIENYFKQWRNIRVASFQDEADPDLESVSDDLKWTELARRISEHKAVNTFRVGENNMVRVERYHSFAYSVIEEADSGWWRGNTSHRDEFWDEKVPFKILELKIDHKIDPIYDVIIVDEGQDFSELWFESIQYFLKPGGRFYVFRDDLQNVNKKCSRVAESPNEPMPVGYTIAPLMENCRNTKNIALELSRIISREIRSFYEMPEGEMVTRVKYKNDTDQQTKLLAQLKELLQGEDKVTPDKILILLNTPYETSCLSQVKKLDRWRFQRVNDKGVLDNYAINYTSIKYFKGLEADIVFIIDTDKTNYDEQVLYTQASRAKHKLYIFEKG